MSQGLKCRMGSVTGSGDKLIDADVIQDCDFLRACPIELVKMNLHLFEHPFHLRACIPSGRLKKTALSPRGFQFVRN